MTTPAAPGFYGKLPSRGDFVSRRLGGDFVERWDEWVAGGLAASRAALGDAWLNVYLTSPIWRFALAPGVCGVHAQVGVMMPSVDKVGRYYPLATAVACGHDVSALAFALGIEGWHAEIENLLLATLADTPLELEEFDRRLAQLVPPRAAARSARAPDCGAAALRHFVLRGGAAIREALVPLGASALQRLGWGSCWWTQGSERVEPCLLVAGALPTAAAFVAMLDGDFAAHGWVSERLGSSVGEEIGAGTGVGLEASLKNEPAGAGALNLRCAAVTDVGKLRQRNEDAFAVHEALGVWMVADGMGGHEAGEIASRMVTSVVPGIEAGQGLGDRVEQLVRALRVVNGCLQVLAERDSRVTLAGSTVAALLADAGDAACVWAGDSRIYRCRHGALEQLSRDHSEPGLGVDSHVITRAVGGPDALEVEIEWIGLSDGDRFLLCTDGVSGEIEAHEIAAAMSSPEPEQACAHLRSVVLQGEARDNFTAVVVYVEGAAELRRPAA